MPKKEQLLVAGCLGSILLLLAVLIVLAVLLVGQIRSHAGEPSPDELLAQQEREYREAQARQYREAMERERQFEEEAAAVESPHLQPVPGRPAESVSVRAKPPPAVSASENLITNGTFNGLDGWERAQSNAPGQFRLRTADGAVFWERTGSRNDGANFGVLQPLAVDVTNAGRLILELDARVDSHTLKGTGWYSEQHDGPGETPVHLCVSYVDENGKSHAWHYGFLLHAEGEVVWWENPRTGQRERKPAETRLTNVTVVEPGQWHHASFDLLDDAVRRDPRGRTTLPRPAKITRIYVYGSGWDFSAGVRNLSLRVEQGEP